MNSRLADEEGRLKILMDVQARHSTFAYITNGTIESIGTNDLPSVAKKKGVAARMAGPSTEAFPTVGLALQLEVPMVVVASILGRKVGGECWNSGLDGRPEVVAASIQLEAEVAATSEAALLRETLPKASGVLRPYENLKVP
jgi:hypothetical protein